MSEPLTQADRDQVAALHAEGKSRNDIARAIGRAPATVTKLARELGLSFDRAPTRAATAAKVADARERRTALALALIADAERLRAQLWEPAVYWDWGGKDHDYDEVHRTEPTPADKRQLIQAASTAVNTSLRLDDHDRDTGEADARSMLGDLLGALTDAHRADTAAGGDDGA